MMEGAKKSMVAVVMGSRSDLKEMKGCTEVLKDFGVGYELKVLSAHRSPGEVASFAKGALNRGLKVIIAAAGGAAHLAGAIASHTTLPVIGVPIKTSILKGVDSYLSILQMPSGVPVATVSIGKAGAKNAAILALQILGTHDQKIQRKLESYKKRLALSVARKGPK